MFTKLPLAAALIAALIFPPPALAVPRTTPYCLRGEGQVVRQIDDSVIICRNLTPDSFYGPRPTDEINLYRFVGTSIISIVSIAVYTYGIKRVIIVTYPNLGNSDVVSTSFFMIDRKFDYWLDEANPDLLEQQSGNLTLLLDTLESSPLSRPSF